MKFAERAAFAQQHVNLSVLVGTTETRTFAAQERGARNRESGAL